MFQAITNFFNWIVDIISSLVDFVRQLINGLVMVFQSIPQAISMITGAIGHLPSTLAVFATLTITISVVYLVIGRETGG